MMIPFSWVMGGGTFLERVGIEKMGNDLKAKGIRPPRKPYLLSKLIFVSTFTLSL